MEKKKHPHAVLLGVTAFASYALVMATIPEFAIPAAAFALIVTVAAGAAQINAGRFFTGVALAFGGWVCLGMIFGSPADRTSAIVAVPLVLALTVGLGAAALFVGRMVARIGAALSGG